MKLRGLMYRLLFEAAMYFVDPRLKTGKAIALEVLDGQVARAIINSDPGLVVKGLDAAVRIATGEDKSTPEQVQQLSTFFDPLVFVAGMAAKNQVNRIQW